MKNLLFFSEIFEKFNCSKPAQISSYLVFFFTLLGTRNLLGHPFVEQRVIPVVAVRKIKVIKKSQNSRGIGVFVTIFA